MFCGLPTSVATLPVFAPVASASKNGSRGSFQQQIQSTTMGAPNTHTASFVTSAPATPEPQKRSASKRPFVRARAASSGAARSKIPSIDRNAPMPITANSSTSVEWSTASRASAGVSAPSATTSTAPTSAPAGRSMAATYAARRPGGT